MPKPDDNRRERWEGFRFFGPAILLTILGFWVAYQFVDPAPPGTIQIATGPTDGAYFAFGRRFADVLARHRVTLEVKASAGSIENLTILNAGGTEVAFIQGGTQSDADREHLYTLGSLYFEPLWVFHRTDAEIEKLSGLAGKRIAVGVEGSGVRPLAMDLLAENAITTTSAELLPLGGTRAADALLSGDVDAAVFVVSPTAKVIRTLMNADGVELFDFDRAEAYARVHRFLSAVTLPEGVIDLAANLPDEEISLLAPAVNLVVRRDLHPALVDLLMQTADEIFSGGGMFERAGDFPSAANLCLPLSPEARRYYDHGPPLLRRVLPFWAASFVDRTKVMLLPMIALLLPFSKFMPPIYRWSMRSRVYRWYRQLQKIELSRLSSASPEEIADRLRQLDELDHEVSQVTIPLAYREELYNMRLHIDLVRKHLERLADDSADAPESPTSDESRKATVSA